MQPAATPEPRGGGLNPYSAPTSRVVVPNRVTTVGGIPWSLLLIMAVLSTTVFWLLWSAVMSVMTGQRLVSVLLGPGVALAPAWGFAFGRAMASEMRPAVVTLPFDEGEDLLGRIDSVMSTLRYRPLAREDGLRTYLVKRGFLRLTFEVLVRAGANEAAVAGPMGTLQALTKKLGR